MKIPKWNKTSEEKPTKESSTFVVIFIEEKHISRFYDGVIIYMKLMILDSLIAKVNVVFIDMTMNGNI